MTVDSMAAETEALRRQVAELHRTMELRSRIEQAKGILMLHYGVGEESASGILVEWSERHHIDLATVASTLVQESAGQPPTEGATSSDPGLHRAIKDVTGRFGSRERLSRHDY